MKKLFFVTVLAALLMPAVAAAQDAFNGTWKIDMGKVDFSKKPDVFVLQNGIYECKSCPTPVKIKADGTDQPVTGIPYIDTMAIDVVNDHEIKETDKKDGKVVGLGMTKVSPDGNTLMFEFTDSSNTNGSAPVTGKGTETRVAKGPAGSNAISGSWRMGKMENISDNAITWTYKLDGDQLTMTNTTGQTYTAKLNGPEAAMKGDPGITSVQVKLIGKNTLVETDKRDGKVIGISKMTLNPDGKSAKAAFTDTRSNRTTVAEAVKQEEALSAK